MKTYSTKNLSVSFDIEKNVISSLKLVNKERLVYSLPIFSISFINKNGENLIFNSTNFLSKTTNFGFEFSLNNDVFKNIVVQLTINNKDEDIFLRFSIKNVPIEYAIEYIETPNFCLPDLKSNGNKILWPYNEGVLVEDISLKENSNYKYTEPTYPSKGSYGIFPNMVFAQFISYHFNDCGLYIGMHDKNRGLKQIDFRQLSLGVNPVVKIYCGCNYGESYAMDFDICLSCVDDEWESSAIKYRNWFENNLEFYGHFSGHDFYSLK